MFASLQRYIPLFEGYLRSKDPKQFSASLADPTEKAIVEVLTEKITNITDFQNKARKLGLNNTLVEALVEIKLTKHLAETKQTKDDALSRYIIDKFGTKQFDYPRPTTLTADDPSSRKEDKVPSSITVDHSLQVYLAKKLNQSSQFIHNLSDYAISKIPQKQLLSLSLEDKGYLLSSSSIITHFKPQFLAKLLIDFQYETRKKDNNKSYTIPRSILSKMTRDQIDHLGTIHAQMFDNEAYVQIWFALHYSERIEKHAERPASLNKQELDDKRKDYLSIIKELSDRPQHIIKAYLYKLKAEVFVLDISVNDTSLDRLIEHLQTSYWVIELKSLNSKFRTQKKQQFKEDETYEISNRINIPCELYHSCISPVEDYLFKLFKANTDNKESITRLSQYFEERYLRELNIKALLARGIIPENVSEYFDSKSLQQLKDKKEISLSSTNKKKYKVEDKVELEASLKNLNQIHIKVYELSLEKHNLLSDEDIADEINLSFLKPTYEEIYQHKPINQYSVEEVTIPVNIEKKMGVFIVDLQGETITSRAVIRKGVILCLEELTEAGQKFSFYNEEGKSLTSAQGLKVWIKDRSVDLKETNYFITDYLQQQEEAKIVASVGNYSQIFIKSLITESYNFNVGYIYNPQSFLVGKKAKIILHGRLIMNRCPMSLLLLKDIKAKVTVVNNQNISSFYEFNFEKWTDDQDQIIEFPVQSYISNIFVEVSAKIKLQTQKQIDVNHSKHIQISLGEELQSFFSDFYLEKDKNSNYLLSIFGLNGEPMVNHDVTLQYTIQGVNDSNIIVVKSDNDGKIHLGPLSIVENLSAELHNSEARFSRAWKISQTESSFFYSSKIWAKAGEVVTLPVDPLWVVGDVALFRKFNEYRIEDLTPKTSLGKGKLTLPVLEKTGFYELRLLPLDIDIMIEVLQNNSWEGDSEQNIKILDNFGKLYDVRKNPYQNISIQNIKIDQGQKLNRAEIQLDLGGLSQEKLKNVRFHVFATIYLESTFEGNFDQDSFNTEPSEKISSVQIKNSTYYSNKSLSDQGAYVWNRQKKDETLVGNNLEKPGIFLKRALVRETRQEDEELYEGDRYMDQCKIMNQCGMIAQNHLSCAAKRCKKLSPKVMLGLNSHNNFLLSSGYLTSNLQGTSVTVEVPLNYNQLEIYLLTPATAIRKSFSLGSTSHRTLKDLRHAGINETSETKAWTMSREVYSLGTGEEKGVNRNSQWRTVGLKDMFDFAKAKSINLYEWSSNLLFWNSWSCEQKKALYDKECCHELNAFIKFKDPQFFCKVVQKHISNKLSKTFVDSCLLGDIKVVKDYIETGKLNTLNPFEKVLLVSTLVSSKQYLKDAMLIVQRMENEEKAKKQNYQSFKNSFDTIINAKLEETTKQNDDIIQMQPIKAKAAYCATILGRPQQYSRQIGCFGGARKITSTVDEREMRMEKKKAFIPVESTKEYTERTYYNVTDYKKQAPSLISPSPFWSELARYLLTGLSTNFLSKQFMNFTKGIEFVLAACFVSSESSSNFDLSDSGDTVQLKAKSPMLLYVKEVKEQDYINKFGVQINQRFLDPTNMYTFEDGMRIEKEVEQFVVKRPYICQTVVTNTSGTPLELQILLDIPKGTIPLCSHEYTQIVNITLNAFTSKQFKRHFYAPEEGEYPVYPSNACKGSTIIAKCQNKHTVIVKKYLTINKLQSFDDILRSGDRKEILKFIQSKNIFDQNEFDPKAILWMLKDKEFYEQIVGCLRQRKYFDRDIWNFAFYHWDLTAIRESVGMEVQTDIFEPAIFEYFPYYSTRTHQFANQAKSTIRNVQFKESYLKFLVASIVDIKSEASFTVAFAYYLILQDRLREAQDLVNLIIQQYPTEHEIQVDYMRCFLDMSLNTHNFSEARKIILKYKDYPVESWAKLFNEVRKTLEAEDEEFVDASDKIKREEFQTQVVQEVELFKIIQPAETTVQVEIFQINLELFFSEFPFADSSTFTSVRPSLVLIFEGSKETKEVLVKRSDYPHIKDATVQITESRKGLPPKRISTFAWANPEVKVKVNDNSGTLQVFVSKKKQPGAYVKVFSKKGQSEAFYRDGYTDMTGTFRYAMSDLQSITQFSIVVLTQKGGQTLRVKPPSKLTSF